MKAPAFGYIQPKTVDDALECLQQHGSDATVLAGGQSLMASLNMRLSNPAVLIDINDIDELSGINMVENQLRIGAMTRQVELEHSTLVSDRKSTRLNSSHKPISYAVFCLKKKITTTHKLQ